MIRRTASVGDWIIGFRSKAHDKVVYVMQVSEVVPYADYWTDPRFKERRPGESPVPDNIYKPIAQNEFVQVKNDVHGSDEKITDLSGRKVLVSKRFWYFGTKSPTLPDELRDLIPYRRGHSVHVGRKEGDVDVVALETWLKEQIGGVHHREPIDATDKLRDWLSNAQARSKNTGNRSAAGRSAHSVDDSAQARKPAKKCSR